MFDDHQMSHFTGVHSHRHRPGLGDPLHLEMVGNRGTNTAGQFFNLSVVNGLADDPTEFISTGSTTCCCNMETVRAASLAFSGSIVIDLFFSILTDGSS